MKTKITIMTVLPAVFFLLSASAQDTSDVKKAIEDLKARVTTLEQENAKLRAEVNALSQEVKRGKRGNTAQDTETLPTEDDARKILEDQIKNDQGRIKLISFKKTDGQRGDLFGVPMYSLEYEAEVEVLEDCDWKGSDWQGNILGKRDGVKTQKTLFGQPHLKKGQRQKISASVNFEKSEKGWRLSE